MADHFRKEREGRESPSTQPAARRSRLHRHVELPVGEGGDRELRVDKYRVRSCLGADPVGQRALVLVAEQYPDLKANQNFLSLQEELTSTENKVSFARQAFNDSVMVYNTYKQGFPALILAGMFGHTTTLMGMRPSAKPRSTSAMSSRPRTRSRW